MKLKNKAQIIDWLEKGDFDAVLTELKAQLKASRTGKDFLQGITSLSAQWEKIKIDKIKGVINQEEESFAVNKLLDKMQVFLETIEAPATSIEPKPAPQAPIQGQVSTKEPSSPSVWWLLLLVLAGIGLWYFVLRDKPVEAEIRICTLQQISNDHWCEEDLPRVSLQEANYTLYVTAVFTGGFETDDLVEGTVYDSNGGVFATKKITLLKNENDIAHSAMIQPSLGNQWSPGRYRIDLLVNKMKVGEKSFVVF